MATWDKDEAILPPVVDPDTGEYYTSPITVEIYPKTSVYPADKITCNQLSVGYRYKPASDLDDDTHYWIRWTIGVTTYERSFWAKNSYPALGE